MPNIFELCSNQKDFDKLQNIKDTFQKIQEDEKEKTKKRIIEKYLKLHIFSSYEEALDWGVKNPGKGILWHCKLLFWEEDKQKFKSYEQEFDRDGIIPFDVIRYYTKEELLEWIQEHIEHYNQKHPEKKNEKWWLDEYGKLSYVTVSI